MTTTLLHGDCLSILPTLPAESVQCIVTSPPYYGLRRYSSDPREIGGESAPDCLAWARREPPCGACYVCAMRAVFRELWRVLRADGTIFLNLGDSYAAGKSGRSDGDRDSATFHGQPYHSQIAPQQRKPPPGMKPKDLMLIPARVALALQSDGWIVRSDIVWSKPNCMPESVTDRPTRAHEYVYLLAKSARYYYDATAISEPIAETRPTTTWAERKEAGEPMRRGDPGESGHVTHTATLSSKPTRNKRSVWQISTQAFSGAHFATMPEALIAPCILAGSSAQACETCGAAWGRVVEKDKPDVTPPTIEPMRYEGLGKHKGIDRTSTAHTPGWRKRPPEVTTILGFAPRCTCAVNTGAARSVALDPFGGSGTVARVAERFQRDAILIDLNAEYLELQEQRTDGVQIELFT